jgi:trk system potassium uptake protein TrkA
MKVIIIGGSKVVYFLAKTFLAKGYHVTIINSNGDDCEWFAKRLKATVICGNGYEEKFQEEAGTGEADCLIAMTATDEDNLIACQIADRKFGVPKILAFVNNPENVEIFKKLGVKIALSTVEIVSKIIEEKIEFEEITNLIPLAEGKINVTEVELTNKSPVLGKPLKDIDFPKGALLACVIRKDMPIIPRGFTVLEESDRLVLITMPDEYEEALRLLTGEK